ncbi:MAG: FIST C-terminal domain-containing protein [Halobacteriovoraceae bacterium]|nr:FIST C-terminal domain-containing protein [Halobacteriovoraceae bacterium]
MKVKNFEHSLGSGWKDIEKYKDLDSESTLLLVFCSAIYRDHPEVFKELKREYPKSVIVGCSTSGEIHGTRVEDSSLSINLLKFENSNIKAVIKKLENTDFSQKIGKELGEELLGNDLKGVILLSDGLKTNGSALTVGINKVVGDKGVIVSGGLAGDGDSFTHTWVLCGDKIYSDHVLGVGMYGESLRLSNSSRGGWDVFGPERQITKSQGNTIYEIDDEPALELYKNYLGEKASELPASGLLFPLQIRANKNDDNKLVRTLLSVNEADNSMVFAGNLPEGYLVQLLRANFERIIDAAGDAAEKLIPKEERNEKTQTFTFAVSCVGRRIVLGQRVEEELEVMQDSLGDQTMIGGFYSYGEIGPQINGKACDLHNQSMTVMNIAEILDENKKKENAA